MMDWITAQQGRPNYVASFVIADIMLLCSFLAALKIDMDLELPINKDAMKGLRSILTNFEILLFLVMMFICGIMYGFVETFLFVFLKEDLHAPMYLLGLTITTGAVVSLPFLYYSDAIVKKVTFQNCLNKRNKRTTNNIAQLKYLKICDSKYSFVGRCRGQVVLVQSFLVVPFKILVVCPELCFCTATNRLSTASHDDALLSRWECTTR